ncbi:MAG: thrombospondin type 3 repeat-containing protein [Myxococcota bacterium]
MQGCYTSTGTRCSDNPNEICNLQVAPAGRCSYGDLATGLSSCVWPHRAGRCTFNNNVGCLTSGPAGECSGLSPDTCDLTFDKFGRAADPNDAATCTCTNATATTVCGGTLSVCSDGDDTRAFGGHGVGLGVELKLGGAGSQTFANMGPASTGSGQPTSTPPYGIENPPVNFDPQRDAGSIGRSAQGTGLIHQARTTDAREIADYTHPTIANPGPEPLNVRKVTALGDSYWGDWFFISVAVSGTFNTHIVTYTCDPPVGWVPGTVVNGAGQQCYEAVRNGISFLWENDLTAAQKTAYTSGGVPVCPPHCYKDFDISTTELQEFNEAGLQDPNAGIQLAIQNGEVEATRVAGERDTIGVAAVTSLTYLVDNDLRCKMGGWGNAAGFVGRCSDGASACDPDAVNCGMGGACCSGQGGSCRACNGPFNAGTNPLGLPIGYNTHGYPELDLVAGERIGGITGQAADVRVPLFVVGTSGNAASDFRDIANEGLPDVDLADMGPVDPGSSFGSGVGTGGTFLNGSTLNIDEACCGTGAGANVVWDPAALGTVVSGFEDGFSYRYGPGGGDVFLSDWGLTYDKGPGPDGIPGCIGDNVNVLNGVDACNQRLGFGTVGAKTNSFFATGQDDRAIMYTIGSTTKPASGPKFQWRDADAATVAYFGLAQNPPTTNSVAAFTLRDLNVFAARSADVLVKVSTTQCPLTDEGPQCTATDGPIDCTGQGDDVDGDGICGNVDNCPTVANAGQEDGAGGLEVTTAGAVSADGVGDACDNCMRIFNPRVPGGGTAYLAANQWATLTGEQRDDDHDGYGNVCDGDNGNNGATTAADTAQYKASIGDLKASDVCGTLATRPCAIFDLNANNATEISTGGINAADTARYKQLIGTAPGPRCTTCPLTCQAGTAGNCF